MKKEWDNWGDDINLSLNLKQKTRKKAFKKKAKKKLKKGKKTGQVPYIYANSKLGFCDFRNQESDTSTS